MSRDLVAFMTCVSQHNTETPCETCGAQLFDIVSVGTYEPDDQYPAMWDCETAQGLQITAGRDRDGRAHLQVEGRDERIDDAVAKTFVEWLEEQVKTRQS